MEESLSGKIEEIQTMESYDVDKEAVVEDSGEIKTEAESVREIIVNGNSESVNVNHDGHGSSSHSSSSDEEAEPTENTSQVVDSGELEEEKTVIDSVVDPVETQVSKELTEEVEVAVEIIEAPGDAGKLESKEIEGNVSQLSEGISGVSSDETNLVSKTIEEATLPSADENDGVSPVLTEVESKTIEEIILPSSEEKRIEEIALPSSEVSPATTDVVPNAIGETKLSVSEQNTKESSDIVDSASKGKVDEANQAMANAGTVDTSKPETIPGNTGNPPIISLTRRTLRPTSWRSCCGLLEVLRRSDR